MALDPTAVRMANEKLWAAHPELDGRQLTSDPTDAALRREWMQHYREASSAATSPPQPASRPGQAETEFSPRPVSPTKECEEQCKDESGRTCNCSEMTTITFYVQSGDTPLEIIGDYISDSVSKNNPQPNTGHTFIAIGDGDLADQKAYGFYPAESWFGGTGGINTNDGFYLPGEDLPRTDIYPPENEHAYSSKLSFRACPGAVTQLEEMVERDIELIKKNDPNAPSYNLANLQCTTWARRYLEKVGFQDPGGHSPHGAAENVNELNEAKSRNTSN